MPYGDRTIWIGYDANEVLPYAVARHSIAGWCEHTIPIFGVVLNDLIGEGLYTRPMEMRQVKTNEGVPVDTLWDNISGFPMSTEFAISRFFILELVKRHFPENGGWALFVDCDVLARGFIDDIFHAAEQQPDKAVVCVPHEHKVIEGENKKDGAISTNYNRKNWSSVMLFNRDHPANKGLTLELLNTVPGRDLHRFCWLKDDEIGYLDNKWNHLVGVDSIVSPSPSPALVHFTNGGPWLPKYNTVQYAAEWCAARDAWARRI